MGEIRIKKPLLWRKIKKMNNFFVDLRKCEQDIPSDIPELRAIREKAKKRSDINDHLVDIFVESISVNPKLIVELGVRGGESLFVFERVANICGSKIVSVDVEDCSHIGSFSDWSFIQASDVDFAKDFDGWCTGKGIKPRIDVLFIDTSHLYAHTVSEIKVWFPFLSERSKVIFHDTNMGKRFFRRDGSMDFSWDNERGVIRAIEEYLDVSFNEKEDFTTVINGWSIKHRASCNGLTILERFNFLGRQENMKQN
jgi:cephalosporin hydroxylase